MKRFFTILGLCLSVCLYGQEPVLVKDINEGSGGSVTFEQIVYQDKLYFVANDGVVGSELWVTDGSEQGTFLVKDVNEGSAGSSIEDFFLVGDYLLFTAETAAHGREWWRTDGTTEGTVLVEDLRAGEENGIDDFTSAPTKILLNDVVYFAGHNGNSGYELFRTDGTADGTYLQKEIFPGPSPNFHSFPKEFAVHDGKVYFTADSGQFGRELWVTNGTAAGTEMVVDWTSGGGDTNWSDLFSFGGHLYLILGELYRTDGTDSGTALFKDINPDGAGMNIGSFSLGERFVDAGDVFYFAADDGTVGRELWKSDGTPDGTVLVKDANPDSEDTAFPALFIEKDGIVYYRFDNGSNGFELWRTDGTESGTFMLKDIRTGLIGSMDVFTSFHLHENIIYFGAKGTIGDELWQTDGTNDGTFWVANINPGTADSNPGGFISLGNKLFFGANDGTTGAERWLYIADPAELSVDFSSNSLLCAEDTTGIIELAISGESPFQIIWEDASLSGDTLINLSSGTYEVTISDVLQQTIDLSIPVSAPNPIEPSAIITNETNGDEMGSIDLEVIGGTPPYQFLWNNGETTAIIENLSMGDYEVTITDANDCTITMTYVVDNVTGIEESLKLDDLSVFPNPNSGILRVSFSNSEKNLTWSIYDLHGKCLLKNTVNQFFRQSFNIEATSLSIGLYFLKLQDEEGNWLQKKILIN